MTIAQKLNPTNRYDRANGPHVPWGYQRSEFDPQLLEPVEEQLEALEQGVAYLKMSSYPEVARWLAKHEFTAVSMSFGREGGVATGEIVYVVTMFVNDKYEQTTTVETPGGSEACILFKTFDMKLNPNLKPGFNL